MRCLEELRLSFRSAEYLGNSEKSTSEKDHNSGDGAQSTKVRSSVDSSESVMTNYRATLHIEDFVI